MKSRVFGEVALLLVVEVEGHGGVVGLDVSSADRPRLVKDLGHEPANVQVHLRHFALGRVLDLEELDRLELERLGDEAVGEDLLGRVEARRDVVVELAREADLVLRRGELLHQRLDALVGLQVRVVLGQREEAREGLRQRVLLVGGVGDAARRDGACCAPG